MSNENKYLDKYDKAFIELGYDDLVDPEKFKNEYLRLLEENGIPYRNVKVSGKEHELIDLIIKSAWEQDKDSLLLEMPGFPSFEDKNSGEFVFPITENHARLIMEYVERYPEKKQFLSLIEDQLKTDSKVIYTGDIRSRMRSKIKSESLGMVHIPTVRKELEKAMIRQQQGKKTFVSKQSIVLKAGKNVIELAAHYDPFYDHSDRPDPMFTIHLNSEHIWGLKYELTDDYLEEEDINSKYRLVKGKLNSYELTELVQYLKNAIEESEIVIICRNEDIIRKINDENLRFKDLYGYTGQNETVNESKLCKEKLQKEDICFINIERYAGPYPNSWAVTGRVYETDKLIDRLAALNGIQKDHMDSLEFISAFSEFEYSKEGSKIKSKSVELWGDYYLKTDQNRMSLHRTYLYLSNEEKEMLHSKMLELDSILIKKGDNELYELYETADYQNDTETEEEEADLEL